MALVRLLDGLQDAFVYPEADGDGEQRQADVGEHAHDAARHQGEEQQQGGAEHHARGLHIPPVEEVQHCRRNGDSQQVEPLERLAESWNAFSCSTAAEQILIKSNASQSERSIKLATGVRGQPGQTRTLRSDRFNLRPGRSFGR